MRCCVYKERAILGERVKLAAGGDRNNPNIIEALDIACDDCPTSGYTITDNCPAASRTAVRTCVRAARYRTTSITTRTLTRASASTAADAPRHVLILPL